MMHKCTHQHINLDMAAALSWHALVDYVKGDVKCMFACLDHVCEVGMYRFAVSFQFPHTVCNAEIVLFKIIFLHLKSLFRLRSLCIPCAGMLHLTHSLFE